ncbi:LysR family transcriptional regulator [Amycolatopsis sp. H20-H5]|uniref:LysR family transcriptional regulator n=1 Tax=Amycolatopsis sp. H20-H5 TaxID=3046309 RepID=UPI003FA390E8
MDVTARQLGYSQPAITYQIKCLERSLGFKLFTRHPSGARLTGDGRMVLSSVRAVLMLMDNIRDLPDEQYGGQLGSSPVPLVRQSAV